MGQSMGCLVCGERVSQQLDVGHHPVSSHFLPKADTPERNVQLALGQCDGCGTIQLMNPVPCDALVPPYDWLFAREPEAHLDRVVELIMALPGQRCRGADVERRYDGRAVRAQGFSS